MPLTPQEIQAARAKYGIKSDPTILDTSYSGQNKEMVGDELTAFLTDGKEKGSSLDPNAKKDNFLTRGFNAVKEAVPSLVDSFQKRSKNITDYTMKTGEEMYQARAQVTPQDIKDFYSGTGAPGKVNPAAVQLLAPVKNALNLVGQTGGAAGDLLGEGLKALYKTVTPEESQKALSNGIHSLMQSSIGQDGLSKIGEGMESYSAWKSTNPEGARAIENVINVTSLFGGKQVESVVTPLVKKGVDTTIDAGITGAKKLDQIVENTVTGMKERSAAKSGNKVVNKAFDSVTPNTADLTPDEYNAFLLAEKVTPKTATKPSQYVLSESEKEIATKNASLLQNRDPVKNSINIVQDIRKKDTQVGDFLRKNNNIFNGGELKNALKAKMEDISDITIDPERLSLKKEQMIDNFIAGLPKKNMEELWKNRKAFDAYIEKAFSGAPSLTKELKKGLRNGVQDFIAERTPEGIYKTYMKDMSQLFDLHDIVSVKAAKEKGKNGLVMWARRNPIKAKTLGWTAGSIPVLGVGYNVFK